MPSKGHISNLEDLEIYFREIDFPKWILYAGHMDKINPNRYLFKNDSEEFGVDESWQKLRSILEMQSKQGGEFTLFIPTQGNRGPKTKISLNMPARIPGLSGYGSYGGSMMGYVPQEELERRIAQERRTWELERKVDDLLDEQDAKMTLGERLVEKILEEDNLLNQVAGFFMKKTPAQSQPSIQASSSSDEPVFYDGERVTTILDQIRPYFESDEAFYSFLDKVGQLFSNNPEMCIGFFQRLNNE